jgi:hypothetical protein
MLNRPYRCEIPTIRTPLDWEVGFAGLQEFHDGRWVFRMGFAVYDLGTIERVKDEFFCWRSGILGLFGPSR